jgi:N-acetylneuraminate synthase
MITLLNAVVQGADIIEKHFTLDKSLEGNDHYHAMDPDDIRTFRTNTDRLLTTTGSSRKAPIEAEADSRKHARRSLVAATDIQRGDEISRDQVAIKRPGTGISPTLLQIVIGRTAKKTIASDEIIEWDSV